MKKNVLFFFFVILFPLVAYSSGNDAVANPAAVVEEGDVRFTVLTPRVIRMEWDSLHRFTDERSFIVINRNLPVPEFKKIIRGGKLTIRTDELELTYKLNTGKFSKENLEIKYLNKKRPFTWNPSVTQKQNLKGTARTLDRMDGTTFIKRNEPRHELQLEDGILSRDGWTLIDDSSGLLFDNSDFSWVKERENRTVQDWYFMAYGSDYKAALKDFTLFAGKVPLPPRFVFGYWWSRYWAYSDNEMRDVVSQFEKFNIPLDVLVVDMDWHETDSLFAKPDKWGQRKHWTGYTWEKRLFPDPDQFFDWAKSKHLKTTLNLHPASGIAPFESQYKDFAKRMNFDISTHENIPWQGSNKKFMSTLFDVVLHPIEQQGVDFWWLDWQQWVFDKDIEKLNNTWWLNYTFFEDMKRNTDKRPLIYHRWGGLGNHRYQIGFSGDAYITWNTLEYQPYFTNTASNVLYGYWSHDIGGHKFIEDERAYTYSRQYMFGDNILVAPIGAPMENGVSDVKVWLPAGNDWYEWHTGTLLNGGQELIRQFSIEEYPIYVKAGAVIPMYGKEVNSLDDNPKKQIIGIFPGAAGEFSIYEDAGNDQRYVAEYATTRVTSQLENRIQRIKIAPREGHYRGMNHSKDYLVRLYGAEMPRSVSLNGMKVNYTVLPNSSEWSYCGKEFMVSIPISNADCNKSYEIVVEFDKANVVDVNDGMIKQLKTLHRAIANRKFKYAGNYVVPEVTGFCSETNLKVSYDPDNFCHYINYFKTHFQEAMEITLKDDLVSPFAK